MKTKRDSAIRLAELAVGIVLIIVLMALQMPVSGAHLAYSTQTMNNNRYSFEYYVTRYTVWNYGTDMVQGDDMATPLSVTISNPSSVFYAQATDVSNPTSLVEVDKQLENGLVGLSFAYLSPGDRFTLTMYHNDPIHSALQGEITAGQPLPIRRLQSPLLTIPYLVYTLALLVLMLGQLAYILLRIARWPGGDIWTPMDWRAFFGRKPREHYEERRPGKALALLRKHWPVVCVLVFLALYPVVYL